MYLWRHSSVILRRKSQGWKNTKSVSENHRVSVYDIEPLNKLVWVHMKGKNYPRNSQMPGKAWLQQGQLAANHKTTIECGVFWEKASSNLCRGQRAENAHTDTQKPLQRGKNPIRMTVLYFISNRHVKMSFDEYKYCCAINRQRLTAILLLQNVSGCG